VARFWHLTSVGLRGDEAVYAGQAAVLAGNHGLHPYFILVSRGDSNFLVFQGILSVIYRIFGTSDVAARSLAAGFSALTIVVVFAIAHTLYGRTAAVVATTIAAFDGYTVNLGRLALLDSTMTFFFAVAMLCLVRWSATGRARWLYGFAAAAAFAFQAKVVGVLALIIGVISLFAWLPERRIGIRRLITALGVFAVACTPVVVELIANGGTFWHFLGHSILRASPGGLSYYPSLLLHDSGAAWLVITIAGLVAMIASRHRADLLPALWFAIIAGFLLGYPLKAFNYALALMPVLAILGARAIAGVRLAAASRLAPVATGAAVAAWVGLAAPYMGPAVHDDAFAGLREAAAWLRTHSPSDSGVITFSHGSAQYVFAFYAHRPSYPFGRFHLDTVMPGRHIVNAKTVSNGRPSRDWVTTYPRQLIAGGQVTYAVYYSDPSREYDDPLTYNLGVDNATHRLFRGLIENYGGVLVDTIRLDGVPRAWIYQLTTRLPHPTLAVTTAPHHGLDLTGSGFAKGSELTISRGATVLTRLRADAAGQFRAFIPLSQALHASGRLVVVDEEGNYAAASGITGPRPHLTFTANRGVVQVSGAGFTPSTPVTLAYHKKVVATVLSNPDGSFTASFTLPPHAGPRWLLTASDAIGRRATISHI
jgi:hypothetical protein